MSSGHDPGASPALSEPAHWGGGHCLVLPAGGAPELCSRVEATGVDVPFKKKKSLFIFGCFRALLCKQHLLAQELGVLRLRSLEVCGILVPPSPGIEPSSPSLEGRLLTTGPPGKSLFFFKSSLPL